MTVPRMLAAVGLAMLSLAPLAADAARAGDVAPTFDRPRLDGHGNVDLAKLKGKPVYLNFFASWCPPCNDEASGVGRFYKIYHPKGLVTVGIDSDANLAAGKAFTAKYGWTFASIDDSSGDVTRAYGGIGLPVHVFIDKSGKISTYRLGEMSPGEIDAAIKKIL